MYICGVRKEEYKIVDKTQSLKEPGVIYSGYGLQFESAINLAVEAVKGLGAQALNDLEVVSGLSRQAVARFLHVTSRSLNRYLEEGRTLDAAKSETILRLLALYKKGSEVMGSKEEFNRWLARPAMGIGNHIPLNLMETATGITLIDEELDRIAHGDVL